MSVSKFESLPNELLIELFEKYVNGVDLLFAFYGLQNTRIDALINQCQQLNFDFRLCGKDRFRQCLGRLSIPFVEKIKELVLSEQDAPDQLRIFFAVFPTFRAFQRLRKFYLRFNAYPADCRTIVSAIRSLSRTNLETLCIKAINTDFYSTLHDNIYYLMALPTLRRFSLCYEPPHDRSFSMIPGLSRVQYFKYSDMSCEFEHLPYIFLCNPELKYLDIQFFDGISSNYQDLLYPLNENLESIPNLRTLILSFMPTDPTTMHMLGEYLKLMPALCRLEIKAHNALLDANAWEELLRISLPSLTRFRLKATTTRIRQDQIDNILASFETPFWIAMNDFYLIITEYRISSSHQFYLNKKSIDDQDDFSHPVVRWWIVPMRARVDDIPTEHMLSFGMTNMLKSLSNYYYFNNIEHLIVYNLDSDLIKHLVSCVNYRVIKYLDVSPLDQDSNLVTLLLPYLSHITSFRIRYEQLLAHQAIYLGRLTSLKSLDISANNHRLTTEDLATISEVFSDLEHLIIHTRDLAIVPSMKTHLPHLRTLTWAIIDRQFPLQRAPQNACEFQFREKVDFSFQRTDNWITIWIDQVVYDEPYWKNFDLN